MTSSLADRLNAARHRRFFGRVVERSLFEQAIRSEDEPFQVLQIYGPGGVGKTALLREFIYFCEVNKTPVYYIDARNIEPSPDAFLGALRQTLGIGSTDSPVATLQQIPHSGILVDTCELLLPLDNWLRNEFLPQLPEHVVVVLAGRNPPSADWRSDPGWQTFIRSLPLRNLSPEESREYLQSRNVPAQEHDAVLAFTHGHPLALSLVADSFAQRQSFHFEPDAEPNVVRALLEQFVQKVPGPAHRAALEACALVRLTTEGLLAEMTGLPDAHELFDWLRGLSFIESGRQGLFPHDTAREALTTDLRWRNPDWYQELHRRARAFYTQRLHATKGQEQQRILLDYVFLHRDNPVVRPFYDWTTSGSFTIGVATESELPVLTEMAERYEGRESARLIEYWFGRQRHGVLVARDVDSGVVGLLVQLSLEHTNEVDARFDVAVAAAQRYLHAHAPLRTGETATLFRFWMARDGYQGVSPVQSHLFVNMVRHYLTTPGLACTLLPCADPVFWEPVFSYADLSRTIDADFEANGNTYGVYSHDWRAVPPVNWLALLAEREISTEQTLPAGPVSGEPLLVLSQPDFAGAVRDALRHYTRPDILGDNPLLRSRLVVERSNTEEGPLGRITALRALIRETAESMQTNPRQTKLYRAIYHTYLHPAPSQERAAELMDLPFSTYRRHLAAGVVAIINHLWAYELHG